jgi:tetratricopeptide (TPR) repeat protein
MSLAVKNYPTAIDYLEKAVQQNPELVSAYYMIGNAYAAQKRFDTALEQYQKVVAKNPKSIPAQMMIGILQDLQKQPAKANEAYQKVLDMDKSFAPAANNLAWNYAEHGGDLDKALSLAQKARESKNNDPSIADTLGWVHLKKKSYPTAINLFKESNEAFKDGNPTVLYHLALAYDKNGDEELARQTLRKINMVKQDFPEASDAKKLYAALGGK